MTKDEVVQIAIAFAESRCLPAGTLSSAVRVPVDSRHFISPASRVMRGDVWQVTFHANDTPGEISSHPFVFVLVEDDNGEVSGWRD